MDGGIRTDLACTVFLTDGYEGGELCIGGVEVKGKAGMCVVYDCGLPHYVKPVVRQPSVHKPQSPDARHERRQHGGHGQEGAR